MLPLFCQKKIGAWNWGLYQGRCQTHLSWETMRLGATPTLDADTNATPADDVDEWDRIMSEFFVPWEGHPWPWHEMRTVTPDGGDYLIPCNYDKLVENGEG